MASNLKPHCITEQPEELVLSCVQPEYGVHYNQRLWGGVGGCGQPRVGEGGRGRARVGGDRGLAVGFGVC